MTEPMQFDPQAIEVVSFDCYGTLIDWEAGIAEYVAPRLARAQADEARLPTVAEWVARWERIQFQMLRPYRPYREILMRSFDATMQHFGLESFVDDGPGLVRSLADWRPFPDTVAALRRIAKKRRLAIISNIDNLLLAQTLGHLLLPFTSLSTAEDAGAYKPDEKPFELALTRIGVEPDRILHAAFGWKYDLAPARGKGMRTAFVNRASVRPPDLPPADLEVSSLTALADLLHV